MTRRSFHVEHTLLETVTQCPICNSDRFVRALSAVDHLVTRASFSLVDCLGCGFRMTSPRPPLDQLPKYYSSPDYISHTNSEQGLSNKIYRTARRQAIRAKFKLIKQQAPAGRLLDIGCGTGDFLAYLSDQGYQTMGVEPDNGARKLAVETHDLRVLPSMEEVATHEQFDVITMWHALEHISSLRSTMNWLHAALSPGGVLIIAVPDRGSWDADHYQADWAAYDVPRHLWHFRRQDLEVLGRSHGLVGTSIHRMWLDAYYICLLSARYRGHAEWRCWLDAVFLGSVSNAFALLRARPTSSSLFIFRKA